MRKKLTNYIYRREALRNTVRRFSFGLLCSFLLFSLSIVVQAQTPKACEQVKFIGPLSVKNAQGDENPDRMGYQFDGTKYPYTYGPQDKCVWSIDTNGVGTTLEEVGDKCKEFKPEKEFDTGARLIAAFSIKKAVQTTPFDVCPRNALRAGDRSFELQKPLETKYPIVGGETLTATSTIGNVIRYAFIFGVSIIGIAALFNLIIAGAQWTSAGGNANMIASAKKRIVATLSAVVLLLASYLILVTINPELVQLREPRLAGFIESANCNLIENCTDYTKDALYDFGKINQSQQSRIKERACGLDSCSVVNGGCIWLDRPISPDLVCQPRSIAEKAGLLCKGPANESSSILSCEHYDKLVPNFTFLTTGEDKIADVCEPDACGINTGKKEICIMRWIGDWDPRGNFLSQCNTLDCNRIHSCPDYKTALNKLGANILIGDPVGMDIGMDWDDFNRTCNSDPCKIGPCKGSGFNGSAFHTGVN